ncbi:MAG: DUF3718 domain-containing protein [Colwellia sp.]|uniref:DUF3718 domain-containing protein n=1 Tax=Colwellia sp. Bg11-12 TaxID=2759817 RepID=UPI0015F3A72D|nr:DUF3718 domain-containing protein [Colwellia sp. Bg11-12]MBA6265523.1 DUF3718 domain-containing protein [Colwellia sp. Bg11-12]
MMRYNVAGITSIIILLLVTQSYSPKAMAYNVAQNICEFVAADDKRRFRSLLKTQRIKIRSIFDDITCNGKNILFFAAASNANNVGEMIIKKLPKKVLGELVDELILASPTLGALAKERSG